MSECPHCHKKISAVSVLDNEQTMTMRLEFKSGMLLAETLGGVITDTAKLLDAVGDKKHPTHIYISGVNYGDGYVEISFAVILAKQIDGLNELESAAIEE